MNIKESNICGLIYSITGFKKGSKVMWLKYVFNVRKLSHWHKML